MERSDQTLLPDTPMQELHRGLGCTLYVLACIDGRLQAEETELLHAVLRDEPGGPLVLEAFHVQYHYRVAVEDAYAYAFRRFAANRQALTEQTKKTFLHIMEQMAAAHDGVSRKENDILRRFRRDLNRL